MRCVYCQLRPNVLIKSFNNFSIIIDPFPLYIGHILIVSKEHYGCTGELPKALVHECEGFSTKLLLFLERKFGSSICFEHGRAGACSHGQEDLPCSHMHIHFLPSKADASRELNQRFPNVCVEKLESLTKYFHGFGEYLFFQIGNHKRCYFLNNQKIPSHYLRRIICEADGLAHLSDWENYHDEELKKKNFEFKDEMREFLEKDIF